MATINTDLEALIGFANKTDLFQADLKQLFNSLQTSLEALSSTGQWNDHVYLTFCQQKIQPIIDNAMLIDGIVENEVKPFLSEYYQRLKNYQAG